MGARGGQRAIGPAKNGVLRCSERRAHNLLAAVGLRMHTMAWSKLMKSLHCRETNYATHLVKAHEVIRTTEPDFGVETAHSSCARYIT